MKHQARYEKLMAMANDEEAAPAERDQARRIAAKLLASGSAVEVATKAITCDLYESYLVRSVGWWLELGVDESAWATHGIIILSGPSYLLDYAHGLARSHAAHLRNRLTVTAVNFSYGAFPYEIVPTEVPGQEPKAPDALAKAAFEAGADERAARPDRALTGGQDDD